MRRDFKSYLWRSLTHSLLLILWRKVTTVNIHIAVLSPGWHPLKQSSLHPREREGTHICGAREGRICPQQQSTSSRAMWFPISGEVAARYNRLTEPEITPLRQLLRCVALTALVLSLQQRLFVGWMRRSGAELGHRETPGAYGGRGVTRKRVLPAFAPFAPLCVGGVLDAQGSITPGKLDASTQEIRATTEQRQMPPCFPSTFDACTTRRQGSGAGTCASLDCLSSRMLLACEVSSAASLVENRLPGLLFTRGGLYLFTEN